MKTWWTRQKTRQRGKASLNEPGEHVCFLSGNEYEDTGADFAWSVYRRSAVVTAHHPPLVLPFIACQYQLETSDQLSISAES